MWLQFAHFQSSNHRKIFTLPDLEDIVVKAPALPSFHQSIFPVSLHIHTPPHLHILLRELLENQLVFCFHSYLTHCRGGSCQRPTGCPPAPLRKVFLHGLKRITNAETAHYPVPDWHCLHSGFDRGVCAHQHVLKAAPVLPASLTPYQRRQQCS